MRSFLGIAIVSILTSFAALSETLFQEIADAWTSSCRIIIEESERGTTSEGRQFTSFDISVLGTPPGQMNFQATSNFPLYEVTLAPPRTDRSLLLHDRVESSCQPNSEGARSALCAPGTPEFDGSNVITVAINNLSAAYDLRLIVVGAVAAQEDAESTASFQLYARYPRLQTNGETQLHDCFVEQASALNIFPRLSQFWQFMLLLSVAAIIASLTSVFRRGRSSDEPGASQQ